MTNICLPPSHYLALEIPTSTRKIEKNTSPKESLISLKVSPQSLGAGGGREPVGWVRGSPCPASDAGRNPSGFSKGDGQDHVLMPPGMDLRSGQLT